MRLKPTTFLPDGSALTVGVGTDRRLWAFVRRPDGKPDGWHNLHVARTVAGHAIPEQKWRATSMPELTADENGLVIVDVSGVDGNNIGDTYVPWRIEYRHDASRPVPERFGAWYLLGGDGSRIAFLAPTLL